MHSNSTCEDVPPVPYPICFQVEIVNPFWRSKNDHQWSQLPNGCTHSQWQYRKTRRSIICRQEGSSQQANRCVEYFLVILASCHHLYNFIVDSDSQYCLTDHYELQSPSDCSSCCVQDHCPWKAPTLHYRGKNCKASPLTASNGIRENLLIMYGKY